MYSTLARNRSVWKSTNGSPWIDASQGGMAATERDYVRTNTGDLVSRRAKIHGSQNLYLKGKVSVSRLLPKESYGIMEAGTIFVTRDISPVN